MGMIIQLSLVTFPKVLTQVNNKKVDILLCYGLMVFNSQSLSFVSELDLAGPDQAWILMDIIQLELCSNAYTLCVGTVSTSQQARSYAPVLISSWEQQSAVQHHNCFDNSLIVQQTITESHARPRILLRPISGLSGLGTRKIVQIKF